MHSVTIDSSIGKLTSYQLDTAAADLRNAGLVAKHAGHYRGAMVNRDHGEVCAVGAIELATYKKLSYLDTPIRSFISVTTQRFVDECLYRCDNAVIVFADFVPSGLCALCDDEKLSRHAASCAICSPREPYDKITHYNDTHCPSDVVLVNMLGLAAARADELARERRLLLAGRLLAEV